MARLGASRIANNLNQLALAANTGNLEFDEATSHALNEACADVREMRQHLIEALGLKPQRKLTTTPAVNQNFQAVAAPKRRFAP